MMAIQLTYCTHTEQSIPQMESVAIIGNDSIKINEIDSIIADQLFTLRKEALKSLVSIRLLEAEANKLNIDIKEYINREIDKKIKEISQVEISKFLSEKPTIDSAEAIRYLISSKKYQRQNVIIDSLMRINNVRFFLKPDIIKRVDPQSLYGNSLTSSKGIEVYIISDFECPSCIKAEKILSGLYKKYSNKVNFKYTYFSGYIGSSGLASEAAAKQGKFVPMHNLLFENSEFLYKDSIYYELANKISLDIQQFEKDMKDPNILKNMMLNKEILRNLGIYSTPSFIVNGLLLDDEFAVNYLEDIIIQELVKKADLSRKN
ncbi:MAG: thioredoxin domain-containing protein [Bacteroidetes bacterium]|nr:thioredoxin domain-containing protein [Bacteroidota bacterium]